MASKPLYIVVAAVGIAAASGAAWWYQNRPAAPAGTEAGTGGPAASPQGGASAPAGGSRPPAVEVARVEVVRLTDDAHAVG
ncbi:MAG: efflux transporter periplasmic adaptor subunit, partial [Ramlibacter sp.]